MYYEGEPWDGARSLHEMLNRIDGMYAIFDKVVDNAAIESEIKDIIKTKQRHNEDDDMIIEYIMTKCSISERRFQNISGAI